jgi:hypothetical protein
MTDSYRETAHNIEKKGETTISLILDKLHNNTKNHHENINLHR